MSRNLYLAVESANVPMFANIKIQIYIQSQRPMFWLELN